MNEAKFKDTRITLTEADSQRSYSLEVVVQRRFQRKCFKNFAEITPTPESLCKKVAGLQPESLLKKKPRIRCFSVILAKLLRTSFS